MACGILVSRAGMEPMSPALEGRLLTGSPGKSLESLFNLWLSSPTLVVAQFSRICRLNLGPALKTVPTLPNPLTVLLLWRKEETQTLNPFTPLDVSYLSLKAGFCFSTGDKSIIYIYMCVCMCVCAYIYMKVTQLCLTLCDPMDYTVHGILQTRIPECVTYPFSRGSSQPRDWTHISHIAVGFFTSWATTEAQEYWSG